MSMSCALWVTAKARAVSFTSAHLEEQPHLALFSPPHLQSVPQLQDPLLVCEAHLQPVCERERERNLVKSLKGHTHTCSLFLALLTTSAWARHVEFDFI